MSPATYRILVGTDFSEHSHLALDAGLDEARRSEGAEVHVTTVIDDDGHHLLSAAARHTTLTQVVDRARELLRAEVTAAVARQHTIHPKLMAVRPMVHVRLGGIAEQITSLANEIRADLVVVGSHGHRGLRRMIMGSVAERTLRMAPCPVLVVRPKDFSAMDGVPVVEPPCPECVAARERSGGAVWWCTDHDSTHEPAHAYAYSARLDEPAEPRNHML